MPEQKYRINECTIKGCRCQLTVIIYMLESEVEGNNLCVLILLVILRNLVAGEWFIFLYMVETDFHLSFRHSNLQSLNSCISTDGLNCLFITGERK